MGAVICALFFYMTQQLSARKLSSFTKEEIRTLYANAKTCLRNQYIEIRKTPKSLSYARILLVIPKVAGSAPIRNQIKRRLRSIFRKHELFENPYDLIIIAKKDTNDLSFNDLEQLLITITKS
jgi:ribonuclease P protein component